MIKHFFTFLVIFTFMSTHAVGKVYEWTDDKGVTSFTDDLDKVPVKYRKKVREQKDNSVRGTASSSERGSPNRETPGSSELIPPDATPLTGPTTPVLIGGRDENGWRSVFGSLRSELGELVNKLPAKREKLMALQRKRNLYHKVSDRVAINNMNTEIDQDEVRVRELQGKLADLETDADKLEVPKEWRDWVK